MVESGRHAEDTCDTCPAEHINLRSQRLAVDKDVLIEENIEFVDEEEDSLSVTFKLVDISSKGFMSRVAVVFSMKREVEVDTARLLAVG